MQTMSKSPWHIPSRFRRSSSLYRKRSSWPINQNGDEARETMITANLRLVVKIAKDIQHWAFLWI